MGNSISKHNNAIFSPINDPKFRFIDLFAGIGGFRIAFQRLGGNCVFSSEWDRFAQVTYEANFGETPSGDITKIESATIPEHDVLLAGFPCQAFSIAGRRMGFEDTRGTMFFEVARILKDKRPKAFFLENVKGLMNHDKGKTLKVIINTLNELGYYVAQPKLVNAKDFGVPQNRERVYIVGFRSDLNISEFSYPRPTQKGKCIGDIREQGPVNPKYYLSNRYLETLKNHRQRHESMGHGFGYEILSNNQIANALVVGGMGRERNLIVDRFTEKPNPTTRIIGEINDEGIRRLTPREWARIQGFPDEFVIPVSDAQAYKQFGNSVAIPAIEATGKVIIEKLIEVESIV